MTITLQLSAEQERLLQEGAARQDDKVVRQILLQAIDAALPELLAKPVTRPGSFDFRALLDQIATEFSQSPALSEHAASRAGIYGDHF